MTGEEIAKVTNHLRRTFNNNRIMIDPPKKPNAPIEVRVGDEVVGTIDRDEDEGEVAYYFTMAILGEEI